MREPGVASRRPAAEGVRRLFVVDAEGRLTGVLSRRDLLRVFLRTDADLRRDIVEQVMRRALWLEPTAVDVEHATRPKSPLALRLHRVVTVVGLIAVAVGLTFFGIAMLLGGSAPTPLVGRSRRWPSRSSCSWTRGTSG